MHFWPKVATSLRPFSARHTLDVPSAKRAQRSGNFLPKVHFCTPKGAQNVYFLHLWPLTRVIGPGSGHKCKKYTFYAPFWRPFWPKSACGVAFWSKKRGQKVTLSLFGPFLTKRQRRRHFWPKRGQDLLRSCSRSEKVNPRVYLFRSDQDLGQNWPDWPVLGKDLVRSDQNLVRF